MISAKTRIATVGGIGSGRSHHLSAADKCEQWRSIDLAHLKRMGLLKPIAGGRIKAITWKYDQGGLDKLGIIPSPAGIRFVKRDDEGKLAATFVAYTHTPISLAASASGSVALDAEGPPASSTGSTVCGVGAVEDYDMQANRRHRIGGG